MEQWSDGVMEQWSDGVLKRLRFQCSGFRFRVSGKRKPKSET